MSLQKQPLALDELESQVALELPDRELMLVTIVITNVLNNLRIEVDVRNVNVALQICAALVNTGVFTCEVQQ